MKVEELANYFDWDQQLNGYSLESSIKWGILLFKCKLKHLGNNGLFDKWLADNKINLENFEMDPEECQVINDPINHGFEEGAGIILAFNFFWEENLTYGEGYDIINLFYSMKDDKFFHFEIDQ